MCTYLIQLRGQMNVDELNALSPHQMTQVQTEPAATLVRIDTDQSGMIGALTHLHNLGLSLISVQLEEKR